MAESNNVDVVIIGAGVAGLIAARTLLKGGVTNLVILEARDRVGGRVDCKPLQNTEHFLDMGAHYIHGAGNNPVYKMAKENNLLLDSDEEDDDLLYFSPDQSKIDQEAAGCLAESLEETFVKITTNGKICNTDGNSVAELFETCRQQVKKPDALSDSHYKALMEYFAELECLDSAIDDPTQVSARSFIEFEDFPGDRWNMMRNGYANLLNLLVKDINSTLVHLRTVVTSIEYSEQGCKVSAKELSNDK